MRLPQFDELDHLDHSTLELLMSWEAQRRSNGGEVTIDWDELNRRYYLGGRPRNESPPTDGRHLVDTPNLQT